MMTDRIDRDIARNWRLPMPLHLEPIAAGTNNRSYLVTAGRDRYVLKTSRDVTSPERLAFEHALLAALDASGLPFAVPAPMPATSGATIVTVGDKRWSLFRRIPGRAAERESEPDARRCGEALAILARALASVRLDPAIPVPDTFGELATVHPAVPDPIDALQRALGDGPVGARVAAIAADTMTRWRRQTEEWPTQLIHSDFYPANVLVSGDAVSGILDFEYAGRGHRAMDFAIGLAAFSTKDWGDDWSWPACEAFAGGYLRRSSLDRTELGAIPTLMLAREVTSLVHWLGRHARGLTERADIEDRARRVLAVDDWLQRRGDQVVRRLRISAGS